MVAKTGTWDLSGVEVHWKLAPALIHFIDQADTFAPHRSTRSDGSIASAGHYKDNSHSDHDPKMGPHKSEWVSAVDLTHSPKHGLDCHVVAEALRKSQDDRIKYLIWDRRIFNSPHFRSAGARERGPWRWGKYTGYDPHTSHLHLSVWLDDVDDTSDWQFPGTGRAVTQVPKADVHRNGAPTGGTRLDDLLKRVSALEDWAKGDGAANVTALTERVTKLESGGRWKNSDVAWMRDAVQALRAAEASPNSLKYNLRFYRRIAEKAGINGSKPEEVADWLLDRLQEPGDGK